MTIAITISMDRVVRWYFRAKNAIIATTYLSAFVPIVLLFVTMPFWAAELHALILEWMGAEPWPYWPTAAFFAVLQIVLIVYVILDPIFQDYRDEHFDQEESA